MRVNSGFFGSSDLRSGRVVRFPSFWSHSELSPDGVVVGGRLLGLDFGWSYFPLIALCTSWMSSGWFRHLNPSFLHSGRTETHALGDVVSLCSGGSVLESRLRTRDGRSCVAVYAPVWWGTRWGTTDIWTGFEGELCALALSWYDPSSECQLSGDLQQGLSLEFIC
ncbi:hypothetical protein YC2023_050890 [Brassica napus]